MVKLIACDMDGTLLDGDGQLTPDTLDLVRWLEEAGIRFVAASGRRLATLRSFFAPVADGMDFVASSGAQVMVDGTTVDLEFFSHAGLARLQKVVGLFDNLHLAVFDDIHSFLLDEPEYFEPEFDKNLPLPERVYELPDPKVGIVKASVYCRGAVMDMAYALSREMGDEFVFAPSGQHWIDVMQRGVNKATGLEQVLAAHGFSFEDVMAFGDSMNDYELLRRVGTSCAMGNARYAIKQICNCVIGTNVEHAVQAELHALLDARAKAGEN